MLRYQLETWPRLSYNEISFRQFVEDITRRITPQNHSKVHYSPLLKGTIIYTRRMATGLLPQVKIHKMCL